MGYIGPGCSQAHSKATPTKNYKIRDLLGRLGEPDAHVASARLRGERPAAAVGQEEVEDAVRPQALLFSTLFVYAHLLKLFVVYLLLFLAACFPAPGAPRRRRSPRRGGAPEKPPPPLEARGSVMR
jgi:hypothetical protein